MTLGFLRPIKIKCLKGDFRDKLEYFHIVNQPVYRSIYKNTMLSKFLFYAKCIVTNFIDLRLDI